MNLESQLLWLCLCLVQALGRIRRCLAEGIPCLYLPLIKTDIYCVHRLMVPQLIDLYHLSSSRLVAEHLKIRGTAQTGEIRGIRP
jgi:hypothetical protein